MPFVRVQIWLLAIAAIIRVFLHKAFVIIGGVIIVGNESFDQIT